MAGTKKDAPVEKPFDEETAEDIQAMSEYNQSTEVAKATGSGVTPGYTPVDFADALRHLQETGADIVTFEGSPWHVVDKEEMIGKRCIIMGYRVNAGGDFGTFVSLMAVTEGEVKDTAGRYCNKVVINDGSTGIAAQWQQMVDAGLAKVPMLLPNGLRKSEYTYTDPNGEQRPAKTYYIG